MTLPSNLTLLPGVRSDHRGHQYKVGLYPSGKSVLVPYSSIGAEPGRTLPLPSEPQRAKRVSFQPVPSKGPRLAVLEYRWSGRLNKREFEDRQQFDDWISCLIKPLMRSPDCGRTWVLVEPLLCDWHVCYHEDK